MKNGLLAVAAALVLACAARADDCSGGRCSARPAPVRAAAATMAVRIESRLLERPMVVRAVVRTIARVVTHPLGGRLRGCR